MRLIDADKIDFGKVFIGNSEFARDTRMAAQELIDGIPTAYDVDKVVKQLEEKSKVYENPASMDKNFRQYLKGIFTGYQYAIEDMKEIGRGQQA